jgi:hypothetical protein
LKSTGIWLSYGGQKFGYLTLIPRHGPTVPQAIGKIMEGRGARKEGEHLSSINQAFACVRDHEQSTRLCYNVCFQTMGMEFLVNFHEENFRPFCPIRPFHPTLPRRFIVAALAGIHAMGIPDAWIFHAKWLQCLGFQKRGFHSVHSIQSVHFFQ